MNRKMHKQTPQQRIAYTLRRCALELHHSGEVSRLAEEMGVSPSTVSRWMRLGHMPRTKARWLERRFGAIVVKVDNIIRRG